MTYNRVTFYTCGIFPLLSVKGTLLRILLTTKPIVGQSSITAHFKNTTLNIINIYHVLYFSDAIQLNFIAFVIINIQASPSHNFISLSLTAWWTKPGSHGDRTPGADGEWVSSRSCSPWHHPHAGLVWSARSGLPHCVWETPAVPGPFRLYHWTWCCGGTPCTKVQGEKKKKSPKNVYFSHCTILTNLVNLNLVHLLFYWKFYFFFQVFEAGHWSYSVLPFEGSGASRHQRREYFGGHPNRRHQNHRLWVWNTEEGLCLHWLWR